jgi:2-polyprenyl-3-methyl-5-hydroxy-6-metoxy-1,4-benzoquinol methylase
MNFTEFYERYWQYPGAEPEQGQLVEERKRLLRVVLSNLPPGAQVLDSGCGNGVFTAFLCELGCDAIGIDISGTAIGYARQEYQEIRFEVASLEEGLPFKDEEFDAVWCTEVLEHLFDVEGALTEINRVLRSNGKLVLTTPYHGLLKNLAISIVAFDKHYDPCGAHIRFFTRRSMRLCLRKTGFVVERSTGVGRFWPVWMSHFIVAQKVS